MIEKGSREEEGGGKKKHLTVMREGEAIGRGEEEARG